jgi:hypothetical protein
MNRWQERRKEGEKPLNETGLSVNGDIIYAIDIINEIVEALSHFPVLIISIF